MKEQLVAKQMTSDTGRSLYMRFLFARFRFDASKFLTVHKGLGGPSGPSYTSY